MIEITACSYKNIQKCSGNKILILYKLHKNDR